MIDEDGFRSNVGIILMNQQKKLFWGRRFRQNAWQFPQGGMVADETPLQALYRELQEEIGLAPQDVSVLAETPQWLYYRLPPHLIRHYSLPLCIGQKQKWFLLELVASEDKLCLDYSDSPEFDRWRWVSYWYPLKHVVEFKKQVYQQALTEFRSIVFAGT